ncbi:MAG: hypothetical protein WCI56_00765 [Hyphomicrobiales bacterium]
MLFGLLHIMFVKVDRSSRMRAVNDQRILEESEFAYRPISLLSRLLREAGVRLLLH